ncbi:uncharacterized protein BJ171DRAFT_262544 [Polychytrium aggregatum]|uniref:uncharacterized protein n=1 Tax=Polychytrium aggregatum TaxID=110093 RepID=UPI0022FEAE37|nr:uncharacterized protein BJ171DRAFT_262544 [Polychytrium aggregatum]KAI9193463.1 hypothetical protein BJ171DRAFT_262544 [Polychytrium aggregatum]
MNRGVGHSLLLWLGLIWFWSHRASIIVRPSTTASLVFEPSETKSQNPNPNPSSNPNSNPNPNPKPKPKAKSKVKSQ